MPPEPPGSRSGGGGGGNGGGSVLGICTRAQRTNSLNRSASQHVRGTPHHQHHVGGGGLSGGGGGGFIRPDIEGLSEKYWGEILERTVSSGNLHHALHHAHHVGLPAHSAGNTTMTTSFSKHSDLDLTSYDNSVGGSGGEGGIGDSSNMHLNKFSNSEPKLCEHFQYQHDVNCAKNKPGMGQRGMTSDGVVMNYEGRSIPDI